MFETGKRYMTCGVVSEIPLDIQLILWGLIDKLKTKNEQLDYLQIFELAKKNENTQYIKHIQEVPPYKNESTFRHNTPVNKKIYVIDDKTHSTMLLAEEY
ncbi:MAG: DUF960 domain-containing protein [Candidatus Wallbacteria bacterium]